LSLDDLLLGGLVLQAILAVYLDSPIFSVLLVE